MTDFKNNHRWNSRKDKAFEYWGIFCTLAGFLALCFFIGKIGMDGLGRIDWDFITNHSSRRAEKSGILIPLLGSVYVLVFTALFAFPIGLGAGVYLEEYSKKNKWSDLLEVNIANLAGVPSVIYGILGLTVFVQALDFGSSILAASLTLSLLVMPIIIVSTREAIKAVPKSIKEAAYGLGATKWQTIWTQILPASIGGVLTGVILALSRAIGETAPLIVVGALLRASKVPVLPTDKFTVLPIQIFHWTGMPSEDFKTNAAAGIIILLVITFGLNFIAVYLRNKWQNKW
ncbi:MAG: phosphate ABC transporter permease PtsA [Flavobacteriaceae bacterium]|nr:MAG: phosphate ABC transporter permease PtsA [Flavobacteriaceae bacterium]